MQVLREIEELDRLAEALEKECSTWTSDYDISDRPQFPTRACEERHQEEKRRQREFTSGEVVCRPAMPAVRDWLVVAYNRQPRVPLPEKTVLLRLCAHDKLPDNNA